MPHPFVVLMNVGRFRMAAFIAKTARLRITSAGIASAKVARVIIPLLARRPALPRFRSVRRDVIGTAIISALSASGLTPDCGSAAATPVAMLLTPPARSSVLIVLSI